jgi:hypothetical protein
VRLILYHRTFSNSHSKYYETSTKIILSVTYDILFRIFYECYKEREEKNPRCGVPLTVQSMPTGTGGSLMNVQLVVI